MGGQGRHLEVAVWPKLLEHPIHELQELKIGSRSSATISSCNNRELLLVPSLPMRDARPLCPSSTQNGLICAGPLLPFARPALEEGSDAADGRIDDGKQQWRWRWRRRRRRDGPGCPLVHGCRRRKRRRAARRRGHTHGVPLLPDGLLSHGTVAPSCPLYPLISPSSAFDSVARQIPDELVEHYLGRSGFHSPDLRLTRLVAVAAQKFVSDIASDSLQHCKARVAAPIKDNKSKQPKDRRLVLTMDDLSKALLEHGVNLKHPEYFADSPSAGMAPSTREE
ncbi:hypothetical protein ACQ4PT_044513 [Festuca glaucescens]